jgi:hypothetical protein
METPECPPADEQMKKCGKSMSTAEYHFAVKKNEALPFGTT